MRVSPTKNSLDSTFKDVKDLKVKGYPKNLLKLFFALKIIFYEVIFRDPPKILFKTSIKITSRSYFYFSRLFFTSRGYFLKNSLKRVFGYNASDINNYQARKRHIDINFLVRLLLGHPGNVPGTNRECPRDKVGLSQGQTQVFSLFYTAEAQFVPGSWDIPGTKGGRKSLCVKSLCASFVP